ncbi:hypothetical protein SteCoe_1091 [Stentor coeruleus]|uniref:Uncharacterized protein n=1 Tax=Stentor coeruleus TaxID=5963 RepID=A0A1R2D2Q6_9CILI|nr:hypothetical protein SteCoe_1091 [Stentor coeruleus]
MLGIRKNDSSYDMPKFFHINSVRKVEGQQIVSRKLLRPDLSYRNTMDIDNDIRRSELHASSSSNLSSFQEFSFKLGSKGYDKRELTVRESLDLKAGVRPSIQFSSPYYSAYKNTLESGGFKRQKSPFGQETLLQKELRKETSQVYLLKSKIKNLSHNRESFKKIFTSRDQVADIEDIHRKSKKKLKLLNSEIEEFEYKYFKS